MLQSIQNGSTANPNHGQDSGLTREDWEFAVDRANDLCIGDSDHIDSGQLLVPLIRKIRRLEQNGELARICSIRGLIHEVLQKSHLSLKLKDPTHKFLSFEETQFYSQFYREDQILEHVERQEVLRAFEEFALSLPDDLQTLLRMRLQGATSEELCSHFCTDRVTLWKRYVKHVVKPLKSHLAKYYQHR